MFFSVPAFLEQLVVLASGSGLFMSNDMPQDQKNAASVAMLLAFVYSGGVNAAIGASCASCLFARVSDGMCPSPPMCSPAAGPRPRPQLLPQHTAHSTQTRPLWLSH